MTPRLKSDRINSIALTFFCLVNFSLFSRAETCSEQFGKIRSQSIKPKIAERAASTIVESAKLGGLFAREKSPPTNADFARQIAGGLFTKTEKHPFFSGTTLRRILLGDSLAQVVPKTISKLITGKSYEFTPSTWLANRTRIRPHSHFDTSLAQGTPGLTLSLPARGLANTMTVGKVAITGYGYGAYLLIVKPQEKKVHEEVEQNRTQWENFILYNYEGHEILSHIQQREQIKTGDLHSRSKALQSKILHEDLMAAQAKQKSLLSLINFLKKFDEIPMTFDDIENLLANSASEDPLNPIFFQVKEIRRTFPRELSQGQKEKISALFQNRIRKSLSGYLAPFAINKEVNDKSNRTQDLDGDFNVILATKFVQESSVLDTFRKMENGAFNDSTGYINDKFKNLTVQSYYFQKSIAIHSDLDFERIANNESAEWFNDKYSAAMDDLFVNEIFSFYWSNHESPKN